MSEGLFHNLRKKGMAMCVHALKRLVMFYNVLPLFMWKRSRF